VGSAEQLRRESGAYGRVFNGSGLRGVYQLVAVRKVASYLHSLISSRDPLHHLSRPASQCLPSLISSARICHSAPPPVTGSSKLCHRFWVSWARPRSKRRFRAGASRERSGAFLSPGGVEDGMVKRTQRHSCMPGVREFSRERQTGAWLRGQLATKRDVWESHFHI